MAKGRKKSTRLPDQHARDQILRELDTNLLVEAAAGTGKTTSMVGRMIALLETGTCDDIGKLAAITFTRKAAVELRSRFQLELERAVPNARGKKRARLESALGKVERCFIGTIHSFCARLLRERPVEAGVGLEFVEIEEEDDARLRSEVWQEFTAQVTATDRPVSLDQLEDLGLTLEDLEGGFAALSRYSDVDQWPRPKPSPSPFKLAKLRKALDDYLAHMTKTSAHLPKDNGNDTLIPLFLNLPRVFENMDLKKRGELIRYLERFDTKAGVIQKEWSKTGRFEKSEAKAEGERWERFRETWVTPFFTALHEERYAPVLEVLFSARNLYDEKRQSMSTLNFQDLLMKSAALLRDKPHVRRYFGRRFTHLLVDEFHDTDPIQAETMLLLTANDDNETDWRKCIPRPGALFVVGDPKQSIYRFRRADIMAYNEVKEILARNGKVVSLSTNFRSSEPIINWVNEVFEPSKESDDTDGLVLRFPRKATDHSPSYVPLQVGQKNQLTGDLSGVLRLTVPRRRSWKESRKLESDFIARTIRQALDTGLELRRSEKEIAAGIGKAARPEDFLIVTYIKSDLEAYGSALQRYGIPHFVTGGNGLNKVEEIALLHTCLNAAAHPDNPVLLVAALRGGLFGVSDQTLYAFKKAGGRFSFLSKVPEALTPKHAEPMRDAYEKLGTYRSWLDKMPPIAAIEKIAGDVGLFSRSTLQEGRDMDTGSLGKAIELLRASGGESWNPAQLVERLGGLIGDKPEEQHDGVSALPENNSVVRVMNLHKVKGLEAPVVFLASLVGENEHEPSSFIDRRGSEVIGYLTISKKTKYSSKTIAHPPGWDKLAAAELQFLRAERLRLRYVATTRAGTAMIISQYETRNKKSNPWQYFDPYIPEESELRDPGEQSAPKIREQSVSKKKIDQSLKKIATRKEQIKQPTYRLTAAKELALAQTRGKTRPSQQSRREPTDQETDSMPGGSQWGTVIHRLLEARLTNPSSNLEQLARDSLVEEDLDENLWPVAVQVVEQTTQSPLWKQAQNSKRYLTEVPFHVLLDTKDGLDKPTLVRGAIDLVFQEKAGWVIVDYKTDNTRKSSANKLARKYAPQIDLYATAWTKCTGEKVAKKGVFFVGSGEVVWI